jgi:hypothetical protein
MEGEENMDVAGSLTTIYIPANRVRYVFSHTEEKDTGDRETVTGRERQRRQRDRLGLGLELRLGLLGLGLLQLELELELEL